MPSQRPSPVLFCDVADERRESTRTSMLNRAEVAAALSVQRLRRATRSVALRAGPTEGRGAVRRALARAGVGGIEVATVDGFKAGSKGRRVLMRTRE